MAFADLAAPEGRLTQFMATSVWDAEKQATAKPKFTSSAEYARLPKQAKGYDLSDARSLFGEYRPHLREFFMSGLQGRCRLDVSDDAVTMTVFGGDCAEPSRVFALRDPAADLA